MLTWKSLPERGHADQVEHDQAWCYVQSVDDLALLGVNASNYGALVLDKPAWEQRFGMAVDAMERAELSPLTASPVEMETESA